MSARAWRTPRLVIFLLLAPVQVVAALAAFDDGRTTSALAYTCCAIGFALFAWTTYHERSRPPHERPPRPQAVATGVGAIITVAAALVLIVREVV